jgi:hypothetical protein
MRSLPLSAVVFALLLVLVSLPKHEQRMVAEESASLDFDKTIKPILKQFCLDCHSTKAKKGGLDLERFGTLPEIRKDLKPWQNLIEQIETGEMPPKDKPQPSAEEKKKLVSWVGSFLEAEAKSRRGDPGYVPLRRLSNAEYDATIRDLTGVDLRPTREFPADGAGGEGFTNAAESLGDISPALFTKYLNAAKEIADRAVLLPEGFRFSPSKTRRDWSDEGVSQLRSFYLQYTGAEGRLPLESYLRATLKHRLAIREGKMSLAEVAQREKLNLNYLSHLWTRLNQKSSPFPFEAIRQQWEQSSEANLPALLNEINAWQMALWQTYRIGNYFRPLGSSYTENLSRQLANDPPVKDSSSFRLIAKPEAGQSQVILRLLARDLVAGQTGEVLWQNLQFEEPGKEPLKLSEYAKYGHRYEIELSSVFRNASDYLAAVVEVVNRKGTAEEIAKKKQLDRQLLDRWVDFLELQPWVKAPVEATLIGREVNVVPLELLNDKVEKIANKAWLNGWKKKGIDLPYLFANSSDTVEAVPGRAGAHGVMVHPTPTEFVAVSWKSPIAGKVGVQARISHAHPNCGNGVAWALEHRRGNKAAIFAEGAVDLGKEAKVAEQNLTVQKGDLLLLLIDAKDKNHFCDLTEIAFSIQEKEGEKRSWNLASEVTDAILEGNPHADKLKNPGVWSFVYGNSRVTNRTTETILPNSVLGRWKAAAGNLDRQQELPALAETVTKLFTGKRPPSENRPDQTIYDLLVRFDSLLLKGIDPARLATPSHQEARLGWPREKFVENRSDLLINSEKPIEIRLPASLFAGRELVVEARLPQTDSKRVLQCQVVVTGETHAPVWNPTQPLLAQLKGEGEQQFRKQLDEFRSLFPLFICFPPVIPTDEVVSLKMFHREDEPLMRLFLSDSEKAKLEEMWRVHRFISRQTVLERDYLPQFIGFVTQDQPKAMVTYFEGQKPVFAQRADETLKLETAAIPMQLDALWSFASRAYRRPLKETERQDLEQLYRTILKNGGTYVEAFRGVLMRLFASPAFLFRIEEAAAGKAPTPVNEWEFATRLSYFLWSSLPDDSLRSLAASGKLREPKVLESEALRMLRDPKIRSLAIEFGTQWLHVRGFDELKEKNEKLFPTFTPELRSAIYEESILFFQDLFQNDRRVLDILDSDATYLNESLAKHYGIPAVSGKEWRRIEGMKKFGRGGVLGLASVQTKEAGASRTSPILRGNWVVETLLGEKLPRPPANVPKLPEEEGADKLTLRQQVEKHSSDPACATCHQRIDPFGFSLEKYDPIGRLREKDLAGLVIDAKAKLKDGTEFEGIDGLRNYLLKHKKNVIVRLFCKRLLGYALGRSVTLSDSSLLDEMVQSLEQNDGKISALVLTIVRSPQFRMIRGRGVE